MNRIKKSRVKATEPLLSIVIISYQTPRLTAACLRSVIKDVSHSTLLATHTQVWVVDNHSGDNSVKVIKQIIQNNNSKTTKIKLIQNQTNVGFAKANNQVLTQAEGKYFLLLNSDTIVEAGSLEKLVTQLDWLRTEAHWQQTNANWWYPHISWWQTRMAWLRSHVGWWQTRTAWLRSHVGWWQTHAQIGLLAANLKNTDGSGQHQGGALPNLITLANNFLFLSKIPLIGHWLSSIQHQSTLWSHQRKTPQGAIKLQGWVGGTALLIAKKVYQKIGPLDDKIFMYGEDVEYCLRAKKMGFLCAIDLKAPIVHFGSASSSSHQALIGEMLNLLYIFKKERARWQLPLAYAILILGAYLRIALYIGLKFDQSKGLAYQQAVLALKKRYNELAIMS